MNFEDYQKPSIDSNSEVEPQLIELSEEESFSDAREYSNLDEILISDEEVEDPDATETLSENVEDSELPIAKRLRNRNLLSNPRFDDFVMEVHEFINKIQPPIT